jgi:hypothetical protein
MEIAATSTEFIHVTAVAKVASASVPSPAPPKFAFLSTAANPAPGDWLTGEWATPRARILVGPAGGAVTLAAGEYAVWVTFTAGTETPVYRAGTVTVY